MSFIRVAQNTAYQLIGRTISVVLGIAALGLLTRYLGAEQFGWYTTAMTFLQFFAIIADLGLTLITVQMISEPDAQENNLINNIFTLRLVVSIVLFCLASALIWLMPYNNEIRQGVALASGAMFFISLQNILQGLFQKHLHMERVALGDVIGRAAILLGFIIAILLKCSILTIFLVHTIANFIQFVLLYWFTTRYISLSFAWHSPTIKRVLARSWPIAVSMIFNLVYLKADILILSLFHAQTEVGLYGAAYRVIEVLSAIPVLLMGIVLPLLTYHWKSDKTQFRAYFQNTFDAMAFISLPIVIGGVIVAKPFMRTFAGAAFADSSAYLQILLLAMLAIFFGALSGHAIVALNKQRTMVWGYALDALISFILYFTLIPSFGAHAAAWVTVFSESFILIMTWYVVRRTARVAPKYKTTIKITGACAVMGVALYVTRIFPFWTQLSAGAVIYIIMILATKTISMQTLASLFKPSSRAI